MLRRTFSHELLFCEECSKWIIYKIIDGPPSVCPRCGVHASHQLTPEEKRRLEAMQGQRNGVHNGMHFMKF